MKYQKLTWIALPFAAAILSVCIAQGQPLVTNVFYDTDLREALRDVSDQTGITIIPDDTVRGIVTLEVIDMPLEECLTRMLVPLGYSFRKIEDYYVVGAPHPQNPAFPILTETTLYVPSYISAQAIKDLISDYYDPYVRINIATNQIAITTSPEMTRSILEDLAKIDRPAKQVMIEALVTELSKNAARTLGIDWTWQADDGEGTSYSVSSSTPAPIDTLGMFFQIRKLGEKYGKFDVDMMASLRALEETGEVDIRANPRLATLNGQPASIFIGREEYYSIVTGPVSYPYTRLELIQVGITLDITPYVSEKNEITVQIKPEVSDVTGQGATELPVVSKRSVSTKIRVRDGETITVGGLRSKQEVVRTSGIPFLGRIPILGYLFKQDIRDTKENEIVVFITPRIMED